LTTYDRNDRTRRQAERNVNGAMKGESHGGISELVGPSRPPQELQRRLEMSLTTIGLMGLAVPL
jgi:hypothetical protein